MRPSNNFHIIRLFLRYRPRFCLARSSYIRHISSVNIQGKLWDGHPRGHVRSGRLPAVASPLSRPFSGNEPDESSSLLDEADELDSVRVHLYPDTDDHVLKALARVSTAEEVFAALGDSLEPRHLCQAMATLWDVHKLQKGPSRPPADDVRRLKTALLERADDCDDLGLVCSLYCLGRLGAPRSDATVRRLFECSLRRLPDLPLAAFSRLGASVHLWPVWPPRLVLPYLRALTAHTAACGSWHELSLVTTAFASARRYLSAEAERRFMSLVHRFALHVDAQPEDTAALLKLLRVLKPSIPGVLEDENSRWTFIHDIEFVQRLLNDLRPVRPAEHQSLWDLVPPGSFSSTYQRAHVAAFLVAFCPRQVPAGVVAHLQRLAERDQLTVSVLRWLSKAVGIGRLRVQGEPEPPADEYLHQLTQLTIALNGVTLRLLPTLTSVDSVIWLAQSTLQRRGVLRGDVAVLDAVVARFNQLVSSPELCTGQLTSQAAEVLAGCLAGVLYRDAAALDHLCRHVVQHREHVAGVVAERVLSAAFSTGYWPSDSPAFEDFLEHLPMPAGRTLRACQALCLYGQLPAHLARTVLGQAFLHKTERQIRNLSELTTLARATAAEGTG
ncbi:uncharacterized protein LOC119092289 [Pollicipes pollicipes]|uniref:uncharacterized protein LOC119092289 n=1 Tax=Pollicipes pollicipes TaxID=41117 RepID=UPI001885857E|nr:uncharacterized protein LOC119092289 [Pollicipes pollicipes]